MTEPRKRGRRAGESPTPLACPGCGGPTKVRMSLNRVHGRASGELVHVLPGVRGVRRHRRCAACGWDGVEVAMLEADLDRWLGERA